MTASLDLIATSHTLLGRIETAPDALVAVAFATVALAEEQRTANLLEWRKVLVDGEAVDHVVDLDRVLAKRLGYEL